MESERVIWVSWQDHRRSRELASALEIPLIIPKSPLIKGMSHLHLALKTIGILIKKKPKILFVQNPSIFLAFITSLIKIILNYRLVVDRHSNFRLGKRTGINPRSILFMFFSKFSLRYADLTIVTNHFLKRIVENKGGNGFVLRDKLPRFEIKSKEVLEGKFNVVFICTYAKDEPYERVIQSAEFLPKSTCIYITGKIPSKIRSRNLPENVILTDYLPETDFVNLLYSANAVMDFTTSEWCLVCGGYEAISLGLPFITSNSIALRELYGDAAIYSNHSPSDIAKCINVVQQTCPEVLEKVDKYRGEYSNYWNQSFSDLQVLLSQF